MKSKLRNILLVVLLVWVPLFELGSCVGVKVLASRGLFYVAPEVDDATLAEYLRERDPVLGWPTPGSRGEDPFDDLGTRVSPSFPDTEADACVATFGDSFTFGDQVEPDEAYPNRLADRLGCRVNNYGVPGYGSDQAFLRFRSVRDDAPVVVLGHYSDNITRNVNRLRNLIAPAFGLGFKPRFVLRDGALTLIPIPEPASASEVLEFHGDWTDNEYFLPGGPAGIIEPGFPSLLRIARLPSNYRVQGRLRSEPSYAAFYDSEHASGALPVTVAIMLGFREEAIARGQRPVLVLLPDVKDIEGMVAGGQPAFAPLQTELEAAGVSLPPVSQAMVEAVRGGRGVCDLYINCSEHFTPFGYDLVARVVAEHIQENDLLAAPAEAPAEAATEAPAEAPADAE